MPARTISKLITTTAAVSALGLAASGSAIARPSSEDCACGGARVTQTTAAAHPVPTPPTWPQNPVALTAPQTVAATDDSGFQWDDAGIGAGGALVIALTAIGGALIVRRRQTPDAPLAA